MKLRHCFSAHSPNRPFQRTRATKRLGVFGFRGVARGAEGRHRVEFWSFLESIRLY